jgi:hypothetical protein
VLLVAVAVASDMLAALLAYLFRVCGFFFPLHNERKNQKKKMNGAARAYIRLSFCPHPVC